MISIPRRSPAPWRDGSTRLLKPRTLIAVAALLIIGPVLGGCSGPDRSDTAGPEMPAQDGAARPTNVVLISIDSLRADHLGAYGYERPTSPRIDRLALAGVVFENAFSTTTWTLPSHLSMLTSLYPEVHGVTGDNQRISDDATLVSETLQQHGYLTGGIVSGPYLNRQFGFAQGFDSYDDETTTMSGEASHSLSTAFRNHREAVRFVDAAAGRPFFLFLHFWDVHYDYTPPYPFDEWFDPDYEGEIDAVDFEANEAINPSMDPRDLEHVIALYDGEVAYTDMVVGRFLAALEERGLWEETLVVLTADHGDEFFEHGRKGHRRNLYNTTLQVPLIVKFPGDRWAGRRVEELAGIVDIVPTILRTLGLASPGETNGSPLQELLEGSDPDARPRPYYADLHGRHKAVMAGDRKLIRPWPESGAPPELYDLMDDPGETVDLSHELPVETAGLQDLLTDWLRIASVQALQVGTGEFEYDDELAERLRSLGYIR